jgi:hypothetical protein
VLAADVLQFPAPHESADVISGKSGERRGLRYRERRFVTAGYDRREVGEQLVA